MKPRLLIIVTGDPRTSPRPAEAVRIAAGVGTWQRVDIALYLREEAVLALGESGGGLVDEGDYSLYWPMLAEAGQRVYVQKDAAALRDLGTAALKFTEISDDQLAELAAEQTCVMRF
jgi:hypothetical protein